MKQFSKNSSNNVIFTILNQGDRENPSLIQHQQPAGTSQDGNFPNRGINLKCKNRKLKLVVNEYVLCTADP